MTIAKMILASTLTLGVAMSSARAEVCYQLSPFIDVIRLGQLKAADETAEAEHRIVFGNWTAGNLYSLPVVGSIDVDVPRTNPLRYRVALHGANNIANPNDTGFTDCTLNALLGGGWNYTCVGNKAGLFNSSGAAFTQISCDTLSSAEVVGGAASQKQ